MIFNKIEVLPGLMNEYRVPELNVQNGVLKALSFLFEYIGEMGKDYIYAVTPLFEDALQERDLVHRQVQCQFRLVEKFVFEKLIVQNEKLLKN